MLHPDIHATEVRVRREMLEKDIEGLEDMDFELTPIQESIDAGMLLETAHSVHEHGRGYKLAITDLITKKKEALEALTKMV